MDRRRLLTHPAFAAAVLVLLLNDHVLKRAWPGVVTGKLSDVAGVFLVAVALGALLGRVAPALAVTAVGFAALKLDADVARLAAPLLGGVTRRDPTDLVALLMLWPAARLMARGERVAATALRHGLLVVLGTAALATTTATSCQEVGVRALARDAAGAVYARMLDDGGVTAWARASGDGRTWTLAPAPADPVELGAPSACAKDGRCYQVGPGEQVQVRSPDGPWTTAFGFSEAELRHMRARRGGGMCEGAGAELFGAVAVVDDAGGEIVLVTMGDQGVLRGAPDGSWSRVAVGGFAPVSTDGPSPWRPWFAASPLALLLAVPLAAVFAPRRRKIWLSVAMILAGALCGLFSFAIVTLGNAYGNGTVVVGVMVGVCLVASIVLMRWPSRALDPGPDPPLPPPPPGPAA